MVNSCRIREFAEWERVVETDASQYGRQLQNRRLRRIVNSRRIGGFVETSHRLVPV
jgi:hypothetical protein